MLVGASRWFAAMEVEVRRQDLAHLYPREKHAARNPTRAPLEHKARAVVLGCARC